MAIKKEFLKFVPVMKVNEATHTVGGLAASETPDGDDEIWDYEYGKAAMQKWSAETLARTTGTGADPSLGNIRVMHGLTVGGKVIRIDFKDVEKQAWIETEPVDDETWLQLKRGMLTGFSIGGGYAFQKQEGKYTRYGADIAEISYVDNPCNPDARFTYVKADGSVELRKFAPRDAIKVIADAGEAGKAAAASFLSAIETKEIPAVEKTQDGEEEMTNEQLTKLAAFLKRFSLPFTEEHLKLAAEGADPGLTVEEELLLDKAAVVFSKQAGGDLKKGMYDIGYLASVLCQIRDLMMTSWYEAAYENISEGGGDESDRTIALALHETMVQLVAILKQMVNEETDELLATPALKTAVIETTKGDSSMKHVEELVKAAKGLAGHFKAAAAHHMKKAEHHEKAAGVHEDMAESHKAMADHHKSQKADVGDGFHKAAHGHHVAMHKAHMAKAAHHTAMHKLHKAHSESCAAASGAIDENADKTQKAATEDSVELNSAISNLSTAFAAGVETITKGFEGIPEMVKTTVAAGLKELPATDGTAVVKTAGITLVGRDGKEVTPQSTDGIDDHDSGL